MSLDTYLNLIDQRQPGHKAKTDPRFGGINRRFFRARFGQAFELASAAGLGRLDSRYPC